MPPESESLSDNRAHRGWAGAASDLLPIVELMEAQYADLRDSHIAERTSWERSDVEYHERQVESSRKAVDARAAEGRSTTDAQGRLDSDQRRLDQAEAKLRDATAKADEFDKVHAFVRTLRGATRSTTRRPREIVDYLTHLDVRDLTLSTPAGSLNGHRITVAFDHEEGVRLTVSSSDSRWASGALAQLDEALRRRVPWWRWVRSAWILFPLFLIAAEALVLGLLRLLPGPVGGLGAVLLGLLAGIVANLAFWGARRALPAFELTSSKAPRGHQAVVTLVGWAVSVGLGVVTNLIS